jgi:cysteine desulfurase
MISSTDESRQRVYLDNNATTPLDGRVLEKTVSFCSDTYGSASSRDHVFGWDATKAVADARDHIAGLINAKPIEILFTSGATESINWALINLARLAKARHAFTSATEHEAVLASCRVVETNSDLRLHYLPLNRYGRVKLKAAVDNIGCVETSFVTIMLANNEIGNIYPVEQLVNAAHKADALFFSDLTQAIGKIPVDVKALGLDLAAFSAHKLYGPKGVGALFIRSGEPKIELEPFIVGGGQERGLRAGTLNVPGIVGFGEACRIAKLEMQEEAERVSKLRDKLENALRRELPDIWVNGDVENRLPNTSNIGFQSVDARTLIRDMHDIAASTKSACSSGEPGPSHVLKAIGLTDDEAYSCIRFSLGRFTMEEEIDYTIDKVVTSVQKLRRNLSS